MPGPRLHSAACFGFRWSLLVLALLALGLGPTARAQEKLPGSPGSALPARPNVDQLMREGVEALDADRFQDAENKFKAVLDVRPDNARAAEGLALAILGNPLRPKDRGPRVHALATRFPASGALATLNAAVEAEAGRLDGARAELARARKLGFDPTRVLHDQVVRLIERGPGARPGPAGQAVDGLAAAEEGPGLVVQVGWLLLGFAAVYAVVMVLMAGAGLLLAGLTRGTRALTLLGSAAPDELVVGGQVSRTRGESLLARLYALALAAGLVLFYVSLPFLVVGLVAGTLGLLYVIFLAGRIPVKLVILIVIAGAGGVWAILRGLFARAGGAPLGLAKTAEECPRLYEALGEVARRVDTRPVDEVVLAPGAEISVHQKGAGPFGLFGDKKRVLTLGLSSLHFLTVGELKAILAHEYAHFSHSDTFYNRFIYQVSLSIQTTVNGMASSGGILNFVNPVFWFLVLYHKCYSLLSAGYSRSREFLADRMAATLYGADTFRAGLVKVAAEGTLFESSIYGNIAHLLQENKAFENMYTAFQEFRDKQLTAEDREGMYHKLMDEKGSLFASHPTVQERFDAVAGLPDAAAPDTAPALSLFDDVEALEKEQTELLTAFVHFQLQAAAAAQQSG